MSNDNELEQKILRLLNSPAHRKSTQMPDYDGKATAHAIMQAVNTHTQAEVERARESERAWTLANARRRTKDEMVRLAEDRYNHIKERRVSYDK